MELQRAEHSYSTHGSCRILMAWLRFRSWARGLWCEARHSYVIGDRHLVRNAEVASSVACDVTGTHARDLTRRTEANDHLQ